MKFLIGYVFGLVSIVIYACSSSFTIVQQERIDLSPYAIMNDTFDCERFFSETESKPFAISFLWGSFGDNTTCLEKVFKEKKLKLFEIHSMNHWCLRDGVCDKDRELYDGTPFRFEQLLINREGWLMQRIIKRLEEIRRFLDANPTDAQCFISSGLETQLPAMVNDRIINAITAILPQCKTVYNPIFQTSEKGLADYIEIHGETSPMEAPCIANTDGIEFDEIDQEIFFEFNKHCDAQFRWNKRDNCIKGEFFIPPHLRECK